MNSTCTTSEYQDDEVSASEVNEVETISVSNSPTTKLSDNQGHLARGKFSYQTPYNYKNLHTICHVHFLILEHGTVTNDEGCLQQQGIRKRGGLLSTISTIKSKLIITRKR